MSIERLAESATAKATENTTGKSEEKFAINVTNPDEFPVTGETAYMPLKRLMEKVSELFGAAYDDYAGCFIDPVTSNLGSVFNVKLYFKYKQTGNEEPVNAFDVRDFRSNTDAAKTADKIKDLNERAIKRSYRINDNGKEGLAKFVDRSFKNRNTGAVNWANIVNEITEHQLGGTVTYAVVSGIDINTLIAELYGRKSDDGSYYQYQVSVVRPIGQVNGALVNWLVSIQRVKKSQVDKLANDVGLINVNGIAMV